MRPCLLIDFNRVRGLFRAPLGFPCACSPATPTVRLLRPSPSPRRQAVRDDLRPLPRRGGEGADPRGRARLRRLRGPAHHQQRLPHGAAGDRRCAAARQRHPHHRGGALLRLRPPGPQARGPRAHHRQAGGQPADHRRHQPPAHGRSPCPADPGLLRCPGRSPDGDGCPAELPQGPQARRPGGGQPGYRLDQDRRPHRAKLGAPRWRSSTSGAPATPRPRSPTSSARSARATWSSSTT